MYDRFTIGELAAAAEIPSTTIRYYERAGLLKPQGRTSGNYRYYNRQSLDQLRFIRAAQAGGFTIEDVRALLELRECRSPCEEVQELIEHRLEEVSSRMKNLRRVQVAQELTRVRVALVGILGQHRVDDPAQADRQIGVDFLDRFGRGIDMLHGHGQRRIAFKGPAGYRAVPHRAEPLQRTHA